LSFVALLLAMTGLATFAMEEARPVPTFTNKLSATDVSAQSTTSFAGEKRLYKFEFTNDLGVQLVPGRAEVSCACTAAVFSTTPVATGGIFLLALEVEWPERHGSAAVQAKVNFGLPDGSTRILTVVLTTEIADLIAMDDRTGIIRLDAFNLGDRGAAVARRTTLDRGRYPIPWDSVTAQLGTSDLACVLTKISDDQYEFQFTPSPNLPIGPLTAEMTLSFSQMGKPLTHKVTRRIAGSVRGPLSASPAALFLGALTPGEHRTERVLVRRAKGQVGMLKMLGIRPQAPHPAVSVASVDVPDEPEAVAVQIAVTPPDLTDQSFNTALKADILLEVALGGVPYTLRLRTIGSLQR
jgi:hypothetical protein